MLTKTALVAVCWSAAGLGAWASPTSGHTALRPKLLEVDSRHEGAAASGGPSFFGDNAFTALVFRDFYTMTFGPLLVITLILAWWTRPKLEADEEMPDGFTRFKWMYLTIWCVAVAADWLQGPYVYALYASYGFSGVEIAQLFVGGFGASMLFGTFVGSMADLWGRKRCAVLYCVLYIVSCLTKHWNHYWILMVGRITGGIATSLLFSTFECWMVSEHCQRHRFSPALLRYIFGLMWFQNYAVAIMMGLIAQAGADHFPLQQVAGLGGFNMGGYTTPFDFAIILLVLLIAPICFLWEENYGDSSGGLGLLQQMGAACKTVLSNWRLGLLGVIVSAFEACMYAFIFNWTPALSSKSVPPPHGLIFSLFMMACMSGSSVFSILSARMSIGLIMISTFTLAAASLFTVSAYLGSQAHLHVVFFAFLIFEFCVGVYFPSIGTVKSEIVPEANRAGVYNIYRVPLNGIVVALLLTEMQLWTSFGFCCALVVTAVAALLPIVSFPVQAKGK